LRFEGVEPVHDRGPLLCADAGKNRAKRGPLARRIRAICFMPIA
jgi:hypothetical protein